MLYFNKYSKKIIACNLVCILMFGACKKKTPIKENTITQKQESQVALPQDNSQNQNSINESSKIESEASQVKNVHVCNPPVRILLNRYDEKTVPPNLQISSKNGMLVYAKPTHEKPILLSNSISLQKMQKNILSLQYNGTKKTTAKEIVIRPLDKHFVLNSTPFQGELSITIDNKGTISIINTLPLNDYLYSVLRYEIIQSWDMEMQKVQAVASRTYALYHILEARKQNRPFDLKNSNFHQTYNGHHEFTHLRKAVEETGNLILTHENKPALTMFDVCCGGIIPAHMEGNIFSNAPYLSRNHACTHCAKNKCFKWNHQIPINDLIKKISSNKQFSQQIKSMGNFREMKIAKKDKAGLVHKVEIFGSKKIVNIPSNKLISLLKPKLTSKTFKLTCAKHPKHGHLINFEGVGYGHQIGLCQYGARELVKQGWNFDKILNFYYPGTSLTSFEKLNIV